MQLIEKRDQTISRLPRYASFGCDNCQFRTEHVLSALSDLPALQDFNYNCLSPFLQKIRTLFFKKKKYCGLVD